MMRATEKYGASPWQQTTWDARAAANFIGGGAGSGLVIAAALSGAHGIALALPTLVGLALIASGLAAVFAELGRPFRAVNVLLNLRRSWMTREAFVAPLVFASGLAAAAGYEVFIYPAAALAALFVYCQSRILQAAKGIPAWRVPALRPVIVATGLAEGAGLWLVIAPFSSAEALPLIFWFGLLVIARLVFFRRYRSALGNSLAPQAAATLDVAWRVLLTVGTLAPLLLAAAVLAGGPVWIAAIGGAAGALAGAYFKLRLVLGAGHTQGFALAHLPVRGARG